MIRISKAGLIVLVIGAFLLSGMSGAWAYDKEREELRTPYYGPSTAPGHYTAEEYGMAAGWVKGEDNVMTRDMNALPFRKVAYGDFSGIFGVWAEEREAAREARRIEREKKRAEMEAKIEELKEKLAARQAEMEAKIEKFKEKLTARRAEMEAKKDEYRAGWLEREAEREAKIEELKEQYAADIRDVPLADIRHVPPAFLKHSIEEDIPGITEGDLEQDWYWGSETQKKPGTPDNWIWVEAGRSSKWICPEHVVEKEALQDKNEIPDYSRVIEEDGGLYWRDSSRGIYKPGMGYAQVITPLIAKEIELYYEWKADNELVKERPERKKEKITDRGRPYPIEKDAFARQKTEKVFKMKDRLKEKYRVSFDEYRGMSKRIILEQQKIKPPERKIENKYRLSR